FHLERGDEGLLRDLHLTELAHLVLALLLLLEKLALSRDVAAVALGDHVLPQRADRLARDDAPADRRLHRNDEHVLWNEILQLLAHDAAAGIRTRAMYDHRQRIDRLRIDEDLHLHEIARLVTEDLVIEGGVAFADRFQPVVEVKHDL